MKSDRPDPRPYALAMEWVAKITTVALEMFLPAVGGSYLDKWLGTNYWALVGVGLGMTVGMWHLLQMTRSTSRAKTSGKQRAESDRPGPEDEQT